MNDSLTITAFE